jgi:hypothetical protein
LISPRRSGNGRSMWGSERPFRDTGFSQGTDASGLRSFEPLSPRGGGGEQRKGRSGNLIAEFRPCMPVGERAATWGHLEPFFLGWALHPFWLPPLSVSLPSPEAASHSEPASGGGFLFLLVSGFPQSSCTSHRLFLSHFLPCVPPVSFLDRPETGEVFPASLASHTPGSQVQLPSD